MAVAAAGNVSGMQAGGTDGLVAPPCMNMGAIVHREGLTRGSNQWSGEVRTGLPSGVTTGGPHL